MRVCWGDGIKKWIEQKTDGSFDQRAIAWGLMRDDPTIAADSIAAGIVYEASNGASMMCHMAADGRLTREFLWANADYAFRQMKVNKLIAPISHRNVRMIAMAWKMGFKPEAVIKDGHPDGDLVLMTLAKQDCRFLEERYRGKAKTA